MIAEKLVRYVATSTRPFSTWKWYIWLSPIVNDNNRLTLAVADPGFHKDLGGYFVLYPLSFEIYDYDCFMKS